MLYYKRNWTSRVTRAFMLWVNGLLPFLWPIRHVLKSGNWVRGPFFYFRDYRRWKKSGADAGFPLRLSDSFPCLFDRFDEAGIKPRHYFHQDLWAARKVFSAKVSDHYDLGSRIDGFVAHCAVFCKLHVVDIRPLAPIHENINFIQGDITDLKNFKSGSLNSLSSLHVFEHIGLGRYNDPVGSHYLKKAVAEVRRVLAPGGNLYFAVPVGIQRLEFNAQRVFAVETVLELFKDLKLVEFSAVNDADDLIINANPKDFVNAEYSCGLFHFTKSH